MRQAGRILPEYRALRERRPFVEIVRTPELAAEATLQPVRRFGTLDAAITFSDILVVPEALGFAYHFKEGSGIAMERRLDTLAQIDALPPPELVRERLDYIAQAQRIVKDALAGTKALLGFAGSPWTLALYMVQGGHFDDGARLRDLAKNEPAAFEKLMEKLSDAVAQNLLLQIEAGGVDAVQIFDSWAAYAADDYQGLSAKWISRVINAVGGRVPVIVFAKGLDDYGILAGTGANVLSVDSRLPMSVVRERLAPQKIVLQGNLDPAVLLETDLETVRSRTRAVLDDMAGGNGFIFNLGHGVPVGARLEAFAAMLETLEASKK